jgi:SAM-dependent methyltransferase
MKRKPDEPLARVRAVNGAQSGTHPPTCPLCTGLADTPVWTVTAEAVRSHLGRVWGADFSEDEFPLSPGATFVLYECGSCGLHFFVPTLSGDAAFYRRLMATVPYEPSRWEFGQIVREMRATDRGVDVGWGNGAFLRMVKPFVLRAVGVDHNLDAIGRLRRAGVEGEAACFSEFAERHPRDFDVACAFHTLEHLAEINQFMRAITRCVRPGGRIFLSVPNRRRFARGDIEPLDCPPHHVSRWEPAQWRVLADRFGLDLLGVRFEEPGLSAINLLHRQRFDRQFDRLLGRPAPSLVRRAYAKLMVGPVRHARRAERGLYSRRGIYGHTMLAQFRLPPTL